MTLWYLVFEELRWRRTTSLWCLVAVAVAVGVSIVLLSSGFQSARETRRILRDLGSNLRILPREASLERAWRDGFDPATLAEESVQALAQRPDLPFTHLLPVWIDRLEVGAHSLRAVGVGREIIPDNAEKAPMVDEVAAGTAVLGHRAAEVLGVGGGAAPIVLLNREFRVARVLTETGTDDDWTVFLALRDAQELFGAPGRIREIHAIDCLCEGHDGDANMELRALLASVLPDATLVQDRNLASARERQRGMLERWLSWVMSSVILGLALFVGVLAAINVRERRVEIGVLRASGCSGRTIAGLFVGKFLVLGFLGALLGAALSKGWDLLLAERLFPSTFTTHGVEGLAVWLALGLTPLCCAVFALPPAVFAAGIDPARCLKGT